MVGLQGKSLVDRRLNKRTRTLRHKPISTGGSHELKNVPLPVLMLVQEQFACATVTVSVAALGVQLGAETVNTNDAFPEMELIVVLGKFGYEKLPVPD